MLDEVDLFCFNFPGCAFAKEKPARLLIAEGQLETKQKPLCTHCKVLTLSLVSFHTCHASDDCHNCLQIC